MKLICHNLYVAFVGGNSILLMNGRSVIPTQLQKNTLNDLHEEDHGIKKACRHARNSIYWPGMNHDIEEMVKRCSECQTLVFLKDQFWKSMLAIWNTPFLCCKSPAQLLLDCLPHYPGSTMLNNETKVKVLDIKEKEKNTYDQHTSTLPPLQTGTCMAICSRIDSEWSLLITITEIRPNCTYTVSTNRGSLSPATDLLLIIISSDWSTEPNSNN